MNEILLMKVVSRSNWTNLFFIDYILKIMKFIFKSVKMLQNMIYRNAKYAILNKKLEFLSIRFIIVILNNYFLKKKFLSKKRTFCDAS